MTELLWTQIGQDIDGEAASDRSGQSVSLSADGLTVAIGAPYNNGSGTNAGQTRVYRFNGTAWVKMGQDIDGEADDYSGYSVSLSNDGLTVAIGANGNDHYKGQTKVYQFINDMWVQMGQDIDGEAAYDQSGYSVSLSADGLTVAIGAPFNDGSRPDTGQTRVYSFNGTAWVKMGQDIDGEAANDRSGWSVSLSADGSRVAIGAPYNDSSGTNAGQTRVYSFNGTSWVQMGQDIDGEGPNDSLGWSVSLSADGSRVAIGAPFNYGSGSNTGQTRVYRFNGTSWIQMGQDIDGEADDDYSGYSVSLSADGLTIAIGAPYKDGSGTDAGQTRVYRFNGTSWIQMGQDIDGEADDDYSGWPVSLSADGLTVAIGAHYNDGSGTNAGQTRVYSYPVAPTNNNITTGTQLVNFLTTTDVAGYIQNSLTIATGIVNTTDVPKTLVNDTSTSVSIVID